MMTGRGGSVAPDRGRSGVLCFVSCRQALEKGCVMVSQEHGTTKCFSTIVAFFATFNIFAWLKTWLSKRRIEVRWSNLCPRTFDLFASFCCAPPRNELLTCLHRRGATCSPKRT